MLKQRTFETPAVAECDLCSELDPTGGFGGFHGSMFSFGVRASSIANLATQMQLVFGLGLRWFAMTPSLQYIDRCVIELARVTRPSTFQPDSPATTWRQIVSPG